MNEKISNLDELTSADNSDVSDMTVDNAFEAIFNVTPITSHNDMANLQGGQTSEYYHFTVAEHTALLALI